MADLALTLCICQLCGGVFDATAPLEHDCPFLTNNVDFGEPDVLQPQSPPVGTFSNTPPDDYNAAGSLDSSPRPQSIIIGAPYTSPGETVPYLEYSANPVYTPVNYVSPYPILPNQVGTPWGWTVPSPIFGSGVNLQPHVASLPVHRIGSGPTMGNNRNEGSSSVHLSSRNNDTSSPWPYKQHSPAPSNRLKRSILPNLSPTELAYIARKMRESTKHFVITRQRARVEEPIPSPCEFCRTDYPQLKESQVYEICTHCMESYLQPFKDTYADECLILRGAAEVDIHDRFPGPKGYKRARRTPCKPRVIQPKPWELPSFKPPNGYVPSEISRIHGCGNCILRKTECWLMGANFGCCYACATYKEKCVRIPQDYSQLLKGSVADDEKKDLSYGLVGKVQTP